jgi:outer membrane lipoprotein-sorting protein
MKKIVLGTGMFFMFTTAYAEFLPQTFSSRFEQEYVSTLKGKIKKGQGTIDYKYPGQIRFETNTPSTVIFTSNGNRSWYYRAPFIEGEQGEVTEMPAKEGASVFIKFFDALKKGLSSNEFYDFKENVITFKGKTKTDLGVNKARLTFKNNSQKFDDLDVIELTLADGKNSKIKFIDLKSNVNLTAEKFNFTPPPNTKKTSN